MRIIYSFDTQGGKVIPGSFFTKMAELSVFSARRTGLPIILYTDIAGYWYFKKTKCEFDAVHFVDFAQFGITTGYWNFGKLFAYSVQQAPFLHIDFDVFLHEDFTIPKTGDIITEMLRDYSLVQAFTDVAIYKTKTIPEKLICSGLLGGYNTHIWKELFEHAQRVCKIPFNKEKQMAYLVGVEEYNTSLLAQFYGLHVVELNQLQYTHFQGSEKEKRYGHIIHALYEQYKL
ncbi:MAG TPA: hypothetical protein PLS12_09045 [Bacteroidales bacterium]|nr:hypothetical protein [Bacteroidales bacterium]